MMTDRHEPPEVWEELAPGRFQRRMGENEQLISFIGSRAHPAGLEQWTVSVVAKFKLTYSKDISQLELIQNAWRRLRHRHPSLACQATATGMLQYIEPDEAALAAWFNESFFLVKGRSVTTSDIIAALRPNPIATLHYIESQNEIILSTAHWRTDGYGAIYLIDEFFNGLAMTLDDSKQDEPLPTVATRLVPCLEHALCLPSDENSDINDIVMTAKTYLATGARLAGTAGIVYDQAPTSRPRGTRHVELSLSGDETRMLIFASEERSLSIYSIVHAAVNAAVYAKAPAQDAQKHFTSTIRFNLRPHLPEPYNKAAGASGIYTGGYLVSLQPGQSLLENARSYDKEYDTGLSERFVATRREYARLALAHLQTVTGPPPAVSNVDVSFVRDVDSMITAERRVERKHDTAIIEILDIGLGVSTLTRQLYCFYWIYRGMLKLQLWYNEAFYSEDTASSVLKEIKSALMSVVNMPEQGPR